MADLLDKLAAIAHELWCRRMREDGWKAGPRYDPQRRVHDALVPFAQLADHDQRAARLRVEASEIAERLAGVIDGFPRGPDRPFVIEEMRRGLEVVFCANGPPRSLSEVAPNDRGRIVSWETDDDGELTLVTVRWAGGEEVGYVPQERELARPEELPSS